MKYSSYKILSLLVLAFALVGLSGCADSIFDAPETEGDSYEDGTQLVLTVALPQATRAGADGDRVDATEQECKINSLRLIAFAPGVVENRVLAIGSQMISDKTSQTFTLKGLRPGDYSIYVMANIPDVLVSGIISEDQLKKVILDYTSQLPEPGNLPMIYEPTAGTTIPAEGTKTPTVHELSMKFACVKVRYNIIFDKSIAGVADLFGENGLKIKDASLQQVSTKSSLVTDESKLYDVRSLAASGSYFDNYSKVDANANGKNDVVTASGNAVATPSAPTSKWLWQGTVYLPERYAAEASQQTRLDINAYVCGADGKEGSVRNKYSIALGGYDGAPNAKTLPRDTYYEVIGTVKTLGTAELDTRVVARSWSETLLPADFVHTYLTLSKTRLSVESLLNDELIYDTDGRGNVEIKCESTIPASNGQRIVEFVWDQTNKKYIAKVNLSIDIVSTLRSDRLGKGDKAAKCYIKAGNIKKYFYVDFDITPYFEIEELVKIKYNTSDSNLNKKTFHYRTNLGGVYLTKSGAGHLGEVLLGSSSEPASNVIKSKKIVIREANGTDAAKRVRIECTDPTASEGYITVTALDNPATSSNPGATIYSYFDFYPGKYKRMYNNAQTQEDAKQDLVDLGHNGTRPFQVIVMPPTGSYQIYFRSINDYHKGTTGSSKTSEFLTIDGTRYNFPTEGGSNNWIDFWTNTYSSNVDNNARDCHRVYIWSQVGETTGVDPTQPVWRFTKNYDDKSTGNGDTRLTPDFNNPGWWYYRLGEEMSPISESYTDKATAAEREYYNKPRPGETLMIFHNGWDSKEGFTLHRASHHLDPGIPLFDFEDREGYIVFDPTSEPYFYTFDDKPVIEDIEFSIYSNAKVIGWFKNYGNASSGIANDNTRYSIWSNTVTSTRQSDGSYLTKIKLKCPQGKYAKGITIKFEGGTTTTVGVPQYVYLGVLDANNWTNGAPRAYFYEGSNGGEYTSWSTTPEMKFYNTEGNGKIYRIEVPAGWQNGKVLFQNNSRSEQRGQSDDNKTGYQLQSTASKIAYTNTKDWGNYGDQPTSSATSGGTQSVLFNGQAYPGNTGYFNTSTKKWSRTKNF